MPHTSAPKVTQVVFIKVDPVMDDASHQHYLSLPGASDVAKAMIHMAWKFPSLPQSGWLSVTERQEGGLF